MFLQRLSSPAPHWAPRSPSPCARCPRPGDAAKLGCPTPARLAGPQLSSALSFPPAFCLRRPPAGPASGFLPRRPIITSRAPAGTRLADTKSRPRAGAGRTSPSSLTHLPPPPLQRSGSRAPSGVFKGSRFHFCRVGSTHGKQGRRRRRSDGHPGHPRERGAGRPTLSLSNEKLKTVFAGRIRNRTSARLIQRESGVGRREAEGGATEMSLWGPNASGWRDTRRLSRSRPALPPRMPAFPAGSAPGSLACAASLLAAPSAAGRQAGRPVPPAAGQ